MWFTTIVLGTAVAYLYYDLVKAKNQLKELDTSVEDFKDFKRSLVGIAGKKSDVVLPNVRAYLQLKNRHQFENIFLSIMDKTRYDQIDINALGERQKQETAELYSKLLQESENWDDISLPSKIT